MLTVFIAVYIIAILLATLADRDAEAYATITVIAALLFIFGIALYLPEKRPTEEIEKFKSKCFVENDGATWNVSAATIDLTIHGISFTFQVGDFKGKETVDGKEVLYTPETLKHCFSQSR